MNNVNLEERAQRITNIGLKHKSNGKSNIAVSSILKRNSFNIIQVIYQVNNILKGWCRPNDFFYICNGLVNENHLWKDVLHLTNEGSSLLLDNFINYLNGNVNNNIWLMTKGCNTQNKVDIKENLVSVPKEKFSISQKVIFTSNV